jgi:hypothetical protein
MENRVEFLKQEDPTMRHAYVYYGPLDENFRGLKGTTTTYHLPPNRSGVVKHGAVKKVEVDGVVVAIMQDGEAFFAAMIDGVRLDLPVRIAGGAHTGTGAAGKAKGFGPSQVTFVDSDEPLLQLIQDAAELNRLRRKELASVTARVTRGQAS